MQISGHSTQASTQHADLQQSDLKQAQKSQDLQVQRDQAAQVAQDQQRVQEAAKLTGVGQHLDITS